MTNGEAVNWLINISADIGKAEHRDLWHYEQALSEIRDMLESAQPVAKDINVPVKDCISRQAAIDAVSEGCQEWRGIFERCKEKLLSLPPVQPEPSIRAITAHLKQRLWETALNNVARKGTLGDAYADVAKNRLDAWMDEITGIREDNT